MSTAFHITAFGAFASQLRPDLDGFVFTDATEAGADGQWEASFDGGADGPEWFEDLAEHNQEAVTKARLALSTWRKDRA